MERVVIISGDFVKTGGMDMPNFAVARELAERGASVQLVAFRVDDELLKYPNLTWHRVRKPLRSYFLGSLLLDHAGRRLARLEQAHGTRVLANGGNCQLGDVNWVHYVHAAYPPARATSPLRRTKSAIAHRVDTVQERTALARARIVIANSERTRQDLVERVGVDDSKIRTVYYGIDPDRFFPRSDGVRRELRERFGWADRPQVAFIGALGDRRKGFDTVYTAWSRLCRDPSWECDLVVIGRGAELPLWRARAERDGVSGRIKFLGFRSDVPDLLAACDALVAPTRYEAYGLGVQEALCTGLPALVSRSAGVAERYPAELSELLLADPDDSVHLERQLRSWLGQRERLRAATLKLAETLRTRTWQTMAGDIRALVSSA